jgi:hypothetical protein
MILNFSKGIKLDCDNKGRTLHCYKKREAAFGNLSFKDIDIV